MLKIKSSILLFIVMNCLLSTTSYAKNNDEQRIFEDVDTFSVHLLLGLKIITSNPNDLPELTEAKNTLLSIHQLIKQQGPSESLSLSQIADIGKIAFQARSLGKKEVAKGKDSHFKYIALLKKSTGKNNIDELNVEQDHAATLAAMQLVQMSKVILVPISAHMKLYEAWMAGDATFKNKYVNLALRAGQAAVFAENNYCDIAEANIIKMRKIKTQKISKEQIDNFLKQTSALGRVGAHAPQALAFLVPMIASPVILAMAPDALKIYAHMELAGCFERKNAHEKAYDQYNDAIDTMVEMGIKETDIAFFRAYVAIKKHNYPQAKLHLKEAAKSELLDKRSREDIITLSDKIHASDNALVEKYFSSVNVSIHIGKILNQRLIDEGYYEKLIQLKDAQALSTLFEQVMSVGNDSLLKIDKDFFKGLF